MRTQLEKSVARYLAQLDTADLQDPSETVTFKKTHLKEKLEKLLPPYAELWSEPEYAVGFDFTAEGILKVADERKVDLIVMGANRPMSAKLSAHFLRAVTYEVIRHAKCPVLTVSA